MTPVRLTGLRMEPCLSTLTGGIYQCSVNRMATISAIFRAGHGLKGAKDIVDAVERPEWDRVCEPVLEASPELLAELDRLGTTWIPL